MYAWLIAAAVLDWGLVVDVGDVGDWEGWGEVVLVLGDERASKSDMIMGRPTKSLMRMWVVAMVLSSVDDD